MNPLRSFGERLGSLATSLPILFRLGRWLRPFMPSLALMLFADVMALAAATITPLVIGAAIDGPIAHHDNDGTWHYAWILLGIAVAQTIFFVLRRAPTPNTADILFSIRRELYAHAQRLPVHYHDSHPSGTILSRLTGDVNQIGHALQINFVWLISNGIALLLTASMLIYIQPILGILVVIAMVPLGFASTVFQTRFRGAAAGARLKAGELASAAEESAVGIRTIKALGGGPFVRARFANVARQSKDAEFEKIRLNANFGAFLAAYPLAVLAFVVLGGGIAAGRGAITVGAFVAFAALYFRMLVPVNWMGSILSNYQESVAAMARILGVLDAVSDVSDPPVPVPMPRAQGLGVQFEDVHFSYPGAAAATLRGVSLKIRPGELVAIVGATGSGKTSLLNLVPRLLEASSGRLLVGDVDTRDMALADLRATIGVAFEEASLFSMSVRDNLTLGREAVTEEEIARALAITQCGFVADLPHGLDTIVGEQGLSLSGGQRQRLALARALLGRPRLLLLDDPTSALDVRTEGALERHLRKEMQGTTIIAIARRPSTALLADRVALLHDGRIVDSGTHHDLVGRSSLYREIMIAADPIPSSAVIAEASNA